MRVYSSTQGSRFQIVLIIALLYSILMASSHLCAQPEASTENKPPYQSYSLPDFKGQSRILIIDDQLEKQQISQYLDYYIDDSNTLDINTITSEKFYPYFNYLGRIPGFGYSSSSFWFRLNVKNITDHPIEWFIEYPYAVVDNFISYQAVAQDSTEHLFFITRSGDSYPFSKRAVNFRTTVVPVTQMPGEETLYFNIRSHGAIVVPLLAWGKDSIYHHMNLDAAINGLYYGVMFAALLYNFFIFLSVRERTYLHLIAVVVASSLFSMTHSGLSFQYLWPDSTWWANICHPFFGFITWLCAIIFTTAFLSTKKELPRLHLFMKILLYSGGAMLLFPFFLTYSFVTQSVVLFAGISSMAMLTCGVILSVRGQRQARLYILAWSSILIGTLLMMFKSFGFLESNLWTDSGFKIGIALLVTILSFGLVDKINTIQQEKQQALDQVRGSEKKYRLLADNVKEVIWTLDLKSLKISYITPSVFSMIGYTPEEAKSEFSFKKMLPPGSAAKAIAAIKMGIALDEKKRNHLEETPPLELECYTKKMDLIWTETSFTFLRDEQNQAFEMLGVSRDITERRRSEKEKSKLEAQLIQSNKLEAIGTLAGGIAHDMNNILTAIMGYVEISLSDVPLESRISKRLERVLNACYRARDLVKQILTFSRQEGQGNVPVNINIMVKEVLRLIRASLPATIKIRQAISNERYIVTADPTKIHQIIMNLCSNAGYAMEEHGGVLTISTELLSIDLESGVKYLDLLPGSYIRMAVSDTGCGMDNRTMERIFEPFFTTKPQGRGTGMGLAMVHGIVKSLGGNIYVYSEVDKGTTFHIFFPNSQDGSAAESCPSIQVATGSENVLYVDDEPPIVEMAQEMLSSLGYIVDGVVGSIHALERFRQNPDLFDIVITDQTMPGMTGCDLAKSIWQIRPSTPVIICSGFNDLVDHESARALGISEYVMKPYSKQDIAMKIRRALSS